MFISKSKQVILFTVLFCLLGAGIYVVSQTYFLKKNISSTYYSSDDKQIQLVFQIDWNDYILSHCANIQDPQLQATLAKTNRLYQANPQENFINLFVRNFQSLYPSQALVSLFSLDFLEECNSNSSNESVLIALKNHASYLLEETKVTLTSKIHAVSVPILETKVSAVDGNITYVVNHVAKLEQFKAMLLREGKLEFLETYDLADIKKRLLAAEEELKHSKIKKIEQAHPQNDSTFSLDEYHLEQEIPFDKILHFSSLQQEDSATILIGFIYNKDIPIFLKLIENDTIKKRLPNNCKFYFKALKDDGSEPVSNFYCVKLVDQTDSMLQGKHVASAQLAKNPITKLNYISIRLNKEGSLLWEQITSRNINKTIVIALDDELVSVPKVSETIHQGELSINGAFTEDEAKEIVRLIRVGSMPLKMYLKN